MRTLATAEADAATIKAAGVREMGKAQAENEQLLNEARNRLSLGDQVRAHPRTHPHHPAGARRGVADREDLRHPHLRYRRHARPRRRRGWHRRQQRIGLGDGIAGQLLSYQANKPIIDRILREAGLRGPLKAFARRHRVAVARRGTGGQHDCDVRACAARKAERLVEATLVWSPMSNGLSRDVTARLISDLLFFTIAW